MDKGETKHESCNGVDIGDSIKWSGNYVNGFHSGTNKVIEIFVDDIIDDIVWFRLDNNKQFILDWPNNKWTKNWEKI